MIQDRPVGLLSKASYGFINPPPYIVDWSTMPSMIKLSMLDLGGIQPITGSLMAAAGGFISDIPTEEQLEYLRSTGTDYQMIMVVTNYVTAGFDESGYPVIQPFSVSLFPASKRGKVESTSSVDFVVGTLLQSPMFEQPPVYKGFNPFSGAWGLFGSADMLISDQKTPGFFDEIGIVTDHFVLATKYDPEDVCATNFGMPSIELFQKYLRHRTRLFFTPFNEVKSRRVWGVESPIELFLLQGLAYHSVLPLPQMIITQDGNAFPSLYDFWNGGGMSDSQGVITEADFYFGDQKVAVFCDGSHHRRKKQREKDQRIDERLGELGIKALRFSGRQIIQDIDLCVANVIAHL